MVNFRNIFLKIEIFDEGCFSIQPSNSKPAGVTMRMIAPDNEELVMPTDLWTSGHHLSCGLSDQSLHHFSSYSFIFLHFSVFPLRSVPSANSFGLSAGHVSDSSKNEKKSSLILQQLAE